MCISEVKISKKNFHYYNHKDYCTIHNLPDNHKDLSPKEGLIILIHKTLCHIPPTITHLHPGRATSIEINLDNKPFKCFCLYAPFQGDSVSHPFFEDLFNTHPLTPCKTSSTLEISMLSKIRHKTEGTQKSTITNQRPTNS